MRVLASISFAPERFADEISCGQSSVSKITSFAGRISRMADHTKKHQSIGQKITFTRVGSVLVRAISCAVVVVVLRMNLRSGSASAHAFSSGSVRLVSPTLTA